MSENFTDEAREYMIKILKYESKGARVTVFQQKNPIEKNFELVVNWRKQEFHSKDNSEPLSWTKLLLQEYIKSSNSVLAKSKSESP